MQILLILTFVLIIEISEGDYRGGQGNGLTSIDGLIRSTCFLAMKNIEHEIVYADAYCLDKETGEVYDKVPKAERK